MPADAQHARSAHSPRRPSWRIFPVVDCGVSLSSVGGDPAGQEPLRQVRVLLKTLLSENVVQLLERTDRNYRVYEMNAVDAVSHAADLRELKDKYYRHRGVIFGKPELDPQEPESIIKTTRKMMKKVRTSVLFQPEPSAKSMEFASSTYSNSPGRERDGEHQPTAPASVYVAPGRASMDGRAGLGNIEVFDKERNTRHSGKLSQVR